MPHVAVSALSHQGLVRQRNEDSLAVGPWTICATPTDSPQTLYFPLGGTPVLVAVADGLGGHPAGDVASSLTVRRLAAAGAGLDSEEAVRDEVRACSAALHAAAAADPELTGMGTTVAGLVLTADQVLVFNVGDSQVFEIAGTVSEPELRQLSTDDSPPPPPGRRTSNIVTSTLGGTVVPREVEPHLRRLDAVAGARYLICSDGLTDPVAPEDLAVLLADEEDDQAAVTALWRAAIRAGGPDNITLALVRIEG